MTVAFGLLLSANANNGTNAGFGNLNANNRSSWTNANGGFRLYRGITTFQLKHIYSATVTLPLGKISCDYNDVSRKSKASLLTNGTTL